MLPVQHFTKKIKLDAFEVESDLFNNCSPEEVYKIMRHAGYSIRRYEKGQDIYAPGSDIEQCGLILGGIVDVIQITPSGREELVVRESSGELIGQAFCIAGKKNSFIFFRASSDVTMLFFGLRRILMTPNGDTYYIKFISNISSILASTNIGLNRKIRILTQKTLRDKLWLFFRELAKQNGDSNHFRLNFTREQIASYVCAERASVCRELGRMQDEGLILLHGKNVTLLTEDYLSH